MQRLKPEIITTKETINGLVALSMNNIIGTLDKHADFALLAFDKQGNIEVKSIVKGVPENKSFDLYSDDEHNVLWTFRGKGVYMIDVESKKHGNFIVSNDGNGKLYRGFTADTEKKILAFEFDNGPGTMFQYRLFDLINIQEITVRPGGYSGTIYGYYDNQILGQYSEEKNGEGYYDWDVSDMMIEKFWDDNLTKALTKFQIEVWFKTKTMHLGKRMLLGYSQVTSPSTHYSVRWDEELKDVKVEPLILQIPKGVIPDGCYVFSQDGSWVKCLHYRNEGMMAKVPELAIYHVSEIYPQGLSLPIYCGYTKDSNEGAFMMHDAWGPCYVEQDSDFPEKLFVYKLNDGLKILAEQAKNALIK